MLAIYKKELRCFFSSMIAPAVIAFILMFAGLFVSLGSLFSLAASIETSYTNTLFVLLIAVPLLSMRSLAREKSSGTQKLLDSLPVSPVTYIMGKFFAMLTVIAIPLVTVFLYTFVLGMYGKVNYLSSFSATVAFILCAGAMLSIGLFISSMSANEPICAAATFTCLLTVYFLPTIVAMLPRTSLASFLILSVMIIALGILAGYLAASKTVCYIVWLILEGVLIGVLCIFPQLLEGAAANIVSWLSLTERFSSFALYGIFDLSSIAYYLSVTALFLFFTYLSAEKRRIG